MFERLSEKLSGIVDKLTGRGALSEENVNAAMREARGTSARGFTINPAPSRPLFAGRLRHTRINEAHAPPIGVALIDRDDVAIHLVEIAVRARHGDGELGKAITAIALDMDFHDFDRVAPSARGEAASIVGSEGFSATHDRAGRRDQHAIRGIERRKASGILVVIIGVILPPKLGCGLHQFRLGDIRRRQGRGDDSADHQG